MGKRRGAEGGDEEGTGRVVRGEEGKEEEGRREEERRKKGRREKREDGTEEEVVDRLIYQHRTELPIFPLTASPSKASTSFSARTADLALSQAFFRSLNTLPA